MNVLHSVHGGGDSRPQPVYLTPAQFCARHNISPATALRWRKAGLGPAWVRMGPRNVSYRLSDCEAWAAGSTFVSHADETARVSASA